MPEPWSELVRGAEGGLPNLGNPTIDTGATRYFDELMGAFVDAEEFRLLRFAGVLSAHVEQAEPVLDLTGGASPTTDAGTPAAGNSDKQDSSDKVAGKIEWEARSGLLTRLAGLFSSK